MERDWTEPYTAHPGVVEVFRRIYADPTNHWEPYEVSEELVDVEESFQLWRFRHVKTVERVIGFKRGTGGSSGVAFLRKALELTFFPELLAVRTEIGAEDVADVPHPLSPGRSRTRNEATRPTRCATTGSGS